MFDFFKRRRREAIRARPFPRVWREIIDQDVPLVRNLNDKERREHEYLVAVFLDEKRFEGCAGLVMTTVIRVTIAAQACLLILHVPSDVFPTVETILVYPHAYEGATHERVGWTTIVRRQARAGEAWANKGLLVLAWDQVKQATVTSEHNVVLHEFAHALDGEDGYLDGAPVLPSPERFRAWAHVLNDEYSALSDSVQEGRETDIDAYGATNRAEFFAVVTEAFFGAPGPLKEKHPELFAELAAYYTARCEALPGARSRRKGVREPNEASRIVVLTFLAIVIVGCAASYIDEVVARPRSLGFTDGTVIDVRRTGRRRTFDIQLDTGTHVYIDTLMPYAAGSRVKVQTLESPFLHRTIYQLTLRRPD
jgi:hypothetical protein